MYKSFSRAVVLSVWAANPVVPNTLSWGLWGQNYFCNNLKMLFIFVLYWHLHWCCKHSAGWNCTLTHIKAVAPDCTGRRILHCHMLTGKKWHIWFKNILDEASRKLLILLNLVPQTCIFWISEWRNGAMYKELTVHIQVHIHVPEAKRLCAFCHLRVAVAAVLGEYHFYLKEWPRDKIWLFGLG